TPEKPKALGHLGLERLRVGRACFLERRAHREERERREQIGTRINQEGQGATPAIKSASQWGPAEPYYGAPRLRGGGGGRKLARSHAAAHRARLGRTEERGRAAFDEGSQEHRPDARPAGDDSDGEGRHRRRPYHIGADHQMLAAPTVG